VAKYQTSVVGKKNPMAVSNDDYNQKYQLILHYVADTLLWKEIILWKEYMS
jgi:hypothetical protein